MPDIDHDERWRPIPGAEGFYSVSSAGRVRSEPQFRRRTGRPYGRILKPTADQKGYLSFRICVPGRRRHFVKVHRMVLLAFVGPCPPGMEANHSDGDKANNRLSNLEYVTPKRNVQHAWETGLCRHRAGEAHNRSKLTDQKVRRIRDLQSQGETLDNIATMFGVTKQCIWFIVKRKTWTHVQ